MIINTVAAGNGWKWIRDGFRIFCQNPIIWIILFSVYLLIGIVLSSIPQVGPIVFNLLAPVFMAGFMLGCKALENSEELEINHLFAGFRKNTTQLIAIGGIYMVSLIVIGGFVFGMTGTSVLLQTEQEQTIEMNKLFFPLLIIMLLLLPVIMAFWFAPVLAALHDMKAIDAMKMSFMACLKNIASLSAYSVFSFIFLVVALIPMGLGLFILLPTLTTSIYFSYRDIFSEEAT